MAVPADTLDVAAIAAEFPALRREGLVYVDSASSAQKPRAVIDAIADAYSNHYANIHRGVYPLAVEATDLYEGARRRIAEWLGSIYEETIFAKNVTEAINLVAYAWGRANVGAGDTIVITQLEHHANIVPWQQLCREKGAHLEYVPIDDDGVLDLDVLDELLERAPKLVALGHVSNVLGTINPVETVVERAHAAGALVLIDGAQAVPQRPVDVGAIGADFYCWTGHKLYGPSGIGVLHGRRELLQEMDPFLTGGDMISSVDWLESRWNELPWKFEAGTSPIVQAAGLGAAVDWIDAIGMERVRAHEADLTAYALERLAEEPGVTVFGPPAEERGAVVSFGVDGVHPHDVAEIIAREGVCIRASHHCAQPLMRRLGVPATSRASFGVHNTRADVDRLLDALAKVREVFA